MSLCVLRLKPRAKFILNFSRFSEQSRSQAAIESAVEKQMGNYHAQQITRSWGSCSFGIRRLSR
jgi:hypothetical protein